MTAYDTYSDDALLTLWKQNDQQAFEYFYKRHFLTLVSTAVHKVYDRHLAEELVQDVFMVLHSNRDGINNNPVAYCYRVLTYKIADYYRTNHRQALSKNAGDEALQSAGAFLPEIEYKELEHQVRNLIASLPEQCRRVLLLRRESNLSNKEVAEHLGISVKTVETHMSKALATLKEKLEYYPYLTLMMFLAWQ